jgi:hypothetical protein
MLVSDMTTEMRFQACLTFSNIEPPAQNASFRSYAGDRKSYCDGEVSMGEGSVSMRIGCSAVTCVTVDLHRPVVFYRVLYKGQYNPRVLLKAFYMTKTSRYLTIREQNCTGFHIYARIYSGQSALMTLSF